MKYHDNGLCGFGSNLQFCRMWFNFLDRIKINNDWLGKSLFGFIGDKGDIIW